VPRTFKEIAAVANANLKDLGKAYKKLIHCSGHIEYKPIDLVVCLMSLVGEN